MTMARGRGRDRAGQPAHRGVRGCAGGPVTDVTAPASGPRRHRRNLAGRRRDGFDGDITILKDWLSGSAAVRRRGGCQRTSCSHGEVRHVDWIGANEAGRAEDVRGDVLLGHGRQLALARRALDNAIGGTAAAARRPGGSGRGVPRKRPACSPAGSSRCWRCWLRDCPTPASGRARKNLKLGGQWVAGTSSTPWAFWLRNRPSPTETGMTALTRPDEMRCTSWSTTSREGFEGASLYPQAPV